jgi:hypothetical protein
MSVAMCLLWVCGCDKVVCLVAVSFCIRILFLSLCVMFELVFVFSWPRYYLLVFSRAHFWYEFLSQTNLVEVYICISFCI